MSACFRQLGLSWGLRFVGSGCHAHPAGSATGMLGILCRNVGCAAQSLGCCELWTAAYRAASHVKNSMYRLPSAVLLLEALHCMCLSLLCAFIAPANP